MGGRDGGKGCKGGLGVGEVERVELPRALQVRGGGGGNQVLGGLQGGSDEVRM